MKRLLQLLLLSITFALNSQHTISGTFSPAKDFSWVIAYHLRPGGQAYVADTAIKEGRFNLELPENAPTGTYRIVYAIPQDEFYFDLLYSGQEPIVLHFDLENGTTFEASEENKLFNAYFKEINTRERALVDFYKDANGTKGSYRKITDALRETQEQYAQKATGLYTHRFIEANTPFIPNSPLGKDEYIQQKQNHYFDHLDFADPDLQASEFLPDKALNYVFTALPAQEEGITDLETVLISNVKTLADHMTEVSPDYQFYLYHKIWKQTATNRLSQISDFIVDSLLTPKAQSVEQMKTLDAIIAQNKLRLGATAPELEWVDDTRVKRLSSLEPSKYYLLVFWSSTCGHCLKELPALHKKLRTRPEVKVVAVGLEDDETTWKPESAKLPNFEHLIALGRWESDYAKLYEVHRTPTYFVLDQDKKIIAKPENDRDVIHFLEKQ